MPWLKKARRRGRTRSALRSPRLSVERLEWRLVLSGASPVAHNDTYLVAVDTPLIVAPQGVLANDTDLEGDTLSAQLFTGPRHGQLSLALDGSFTYTPNAGYVGLDSFAYRALDGTSGSGLAAATLRVGLPAGAPVIDLDADDNTAFGLDYQTTFTSGGPAVPVSDFDTTLTDSNSTFLLSARVTISNRLDGLAEALSVNTTGTVIAATYDASAGRLDLSGVDSLEHYRQVIRSIAYRNTAVHPHLDVREVTVEVNDGTTYGPTATAHIAILAINHSPVAANDAFAIVQDSTLTLLAPGLLSNDTDADGDTLTAEVANPPLHGVLLLAADGSLTYTPHLGFVGDDRFTYRALDQGAASNLATVLIAVAANGDAPVAVNDAYGVAASTTLEVGAPGVLSNDTAASGAAAVLVANPLHGTVTLQPNGSFVYVPEVGFFGTDGFSYQIQAGQQFSDIASVTLTVLGAIEAGTLAAVEDTYLLNPGESSVQSSDSVVSNDALSGSGIQTTVDIPPALGALSLNGDGTFTFVPGASFRGIDGFTYRVSNADGDNSTARVDLLSQLADLVRKVYRHILSRDPEAEAWQFWTNAVTDGDQTLGDLAAALLDSDEYLTNSIQQYYRDYLHREAETSGLEYWRGQWRAYGGPDAVQAGILASDELRAIGGDNDGWVTELYRRYLNREPEQVGFDWWTGMLANGSMNYLQVAFGFVTSTENSRNLSAFWYGHYLARSILASELSVRVSELGSNVPTREEAVQVNIVDGLEYRSVPPTPSTGIAQRV